MKNDKLEKDVIKLFKRQLDYYSPDYVIMTNAFVSRFFEKNLSKEKESKNIKKENYKDCRELKDIPTIENYKKSKVFLSTIFSSGKDNYSLKRLQDEIKTEINPLYRFIVNFYRSIRR